MSKRNVFCVILTLSSVNGKGVAKSAPSSHFHNEQEKKNSNFHVVDVVIIVNAHRLICVVRVAWDGCFSFSTATDYRLLSVCCCLCRRRHRRLTNRQIWQMVNDGEPGAGIVVWQSAPAQTRKKTKKKNRNDDGFWHVNRAAQIKWIGRRTPKTESESILEEKKNQLNAFELCCCLGFLLLLLLIWAGADIYVTPLMVVDQFRAVFFFWIDVMKLKRSFVILYDIYISRRGNWGWWDWIIIRRPKRLSLFMLWRTLEFDWN